MLFVWSKPTDVISIIQRLGLGFLCFITKCLQNVFYALLQNYKMSLLQNYKVLCFITKSSVIVWAWAPGLRYHTQLNYSQVKVYTLQADALKHQYFECLVIHS